MTKPAAPILPADPSAAPLTATVITVSDRSAAGVRADTSGPTAVTLLEEAGVRCQLVLVPDEEEQIAQAIRESSADLVFTTGGTGVAPRDVTPQATAPLLEFGLPGVAALIRERGQQKTIFAALSRGLVGVRTASTGKRQLVVNAPGSGGGVRDAVAVVLEVLPHVVDQFAGGDH